MWCTAAGEDDHDRAVAAADRVALEPAAETALLSINYTSGTTGRAEGRDVHAPRRRPARARRHRRGRPAPELALPVDAADVPLPRLGFTVGGHRDGRRATSACATVDPRARLAADRRGGRHAPVRRADRAASMLVDAAAPQPPSPRRCACHGGGAPPAPALLERCEALELRGHHLYGLTETYGPLAVCAWIPDWERSRRRAAGAPEGPPGRADRRRPSRCASSTTSCATCPPTARRSARS